MKQKYFIIITVISSALFSCKKDWLDVKPNKSLVVPSNVEDYQKLLDNTTQIFNVNQPGLQEIGSGDFYINYASWQALSSNQEMNGYIWASDIYNGQADVGDWDASYYQIFNANVVLNGISNINIDTANQSGWNNLKGSALFFRAFAFYNLAQLYAKPFSDQTATVDLGIPLRLSSDVNDKTVRASLQKTYDQIINDLLEAGPYLPITPLYVTRPSKTAVYALLARAYLAMENYDKAFIFSDSCLKLYDTLLDYNTLNANAANPLPKLNKEVIFHSTLLNYGIFSPSNLIVDSILYSLYDLNDLRRKCYFKKVSGNNTFKGSYNGSRVLFGGLAVDEIYLIRAECSARKGDFSSAITDLNTLLEKRWTSGTFVALTANNADDALVQILSERRKELCYRGLRWTDLRRLNKDPNFATTLIRSLNGTTYSLAPNDPKYVLPIPDEVIRLSGIQQNQR